MKAVKAIIAIRDRGPRLFDDFEIVRVCGPAASSPPLQDRNPSLFDIAGRLVGDAKLIDSCKKLEDKSCDKHVILLYLNTRIRKLKELFKRVLQLVYIHKIDLLEDSIL
jgi:hypothetical protein